jgi:hypothetical protein
MTVLRDYNAHVVSFHAARYAAKIAAFNFGNLYSFVDGLRNQAVFDFEGIVLAALPLSEDFAVSQWIAHCERAHLGFAQVSALEQAFRKSLRHERKKDEKAAQPAADPFLYDGTPLAVPVRKPRVIEVPPDAGRFSETEALRKAQAEPETERLRRADIQAFRNLLMQQVSWCDRDEGSRYDMTKFIDYTYRAIVSLLENQRKYLGKINAEAKNMQRAALTGEEIDQQEWQRNQRLREAIIRSGFMFKDMLEAYTEARHRTYDMTGLEQRAFRSWSDLKRDKDYYRQLKVQVINADKLVGATTEQMEFYRRITGSDLHGTLVDLDDGDPSKSGGGVDALPDEAIASNIREVANVAERAKRRDRAKDAEPKAYTKVRPRTVPAKKVTHAERVLTEAVRDAHASPRVAAKSLTQLQYEALQAEKEAAKQAKARG